VGKRIRCWAEARAAGIAITTADRAQQQRSVFEAMANADRRDEGLPSGKNGEKFRRWNTKSRRLRQEQPKMIVIFAADGRSGCD
jgi:hypothetical protein